ncbi:MAG: hypothetical protein ACR2PZ_06030 [Pseudomonadales bacterium]
MPVSLLRTLLLSFVLVLALASTAHAAVPGSPGPTSTGSLDINLIMGLNVRISGLNDLPLGTWSGSGDVAGDDDLCIGRTGIGFFGSGLYRILATGDGRPGNPAAFTLSNGATQIEYEAFFNDQTGVVGRQPLVPGAALTSQSGFGGWFALNYLFGCAVQNANISVVIRDSVLRGAAGPYSGTLTLVLIPE